MTSHLIPRRLVLLALAGGLSASVALFGAEPAKETPLVTKAKAAMDGRRYNEALNLATQAIEADPADLNAFYVRGRIYEQKRQWEEAISDYTVVLKTDSKATGVYLRRANLYNQKSQFEEAFADYTAFIKASGEKATWDAYKYRADVELRTGKIGASILDYNKAVALNPKFEPQNWERGISFYYAGRYEEGAKQFVLQSTVNPDDVENAVWNYICVARQDGVEKARAKIMTIKRDGRVPMMQIYALYAGKATPESVLAACQVQGLTEQEINGHLFYAHLYLGLYFEAQGDQARTREHIFKAADEYRMSHFMGDVARVHAARLRASDKDAK